MGKSGNGCLQAQVEELGRALGKIFLALLDVEGDRRNLYGVLIKHLRVLL